MMNLLTYKMYDVLTYKFEFYFRYKMLYLQCMYNLMDANMYLWSNKFN